MSKQFLWQEDVGPIADVDVATFDLPEDYSIVQAFTSKDAPKHKELSEGLQLIAEVHFLSHGSVSMSCSCQHNFVSSTSHGTLETIRMV